MSDADMKENQDRIEIAESLFGILPQNMTMEEARAEKSGEGTRKLVEFRYNRTTYGMAMGSGSSSADEVSWCRDGSVILTATYSGGGKNMRSEYRVTPEMAQKVRDFVEDNGIVQLAEEKIELPVMFDCFTSSMIVMHFDDSANGGSPYQSVVLDCGPAGMTFRTLENKVAELLKECRETGEYVGGEMMENSGPGAGMGLMGFPGMPAAPSAPEPPKVLWTCPECGKTENYMKFCIKCGTPKPEPAGTGSGPETQGGAENAGEKPLTWTCSACGYAENRGKFCSNCGQPR